jgi:hypothetical protein
MADIPQASKFYSLIGTTDTSKTTYKAYKIETATNATILYSPTHVPLLAVCLLSTNPSCKSVLYDATDILPPVWDLWGTRSPSFNGDNSKRYIQALFTQDNVEFEFAISNLTNKHIHFTIQKYTSDGPCGYINKINVSRPYETVEIKTDTSENERTMILESEKTSTGQKVKLKNAVEQKKGMYFVFACFPEYNRMDRLHAAESEFTNVKWNVDNTFVITRENKQEKKKQKSVFARSFISMPDELYSRKTEPVKTAEREKMEEMEEMEEDDDDGNFFSLFDDDELITTYINDAPSQTQLIKESNVASIKYGGVQNISSKQVDLEFSSTYAACIFGLSIQPNLRFSDTSNIINYSDVIADFIKHTDSPALSKVYASTECCICLEKEPANNVTFYQCAHKCSHKACSEQLSICPLCRGPIIARL